jgi:GH25 family lysozyme M1 (1,4-beta-N-acetylmuramidase)
MADIRTLVSDISWYQDIPSTPAKPELGQMKSAGIMGVILRCSEATYRDKLFEYYWGECEIHDIAPSVYGFLDYWPGSPPAAVQGKFLADWFKGKKKVRAFCDFEQPNGSYPAKPPRAECLNQIQDWMGAVDTEMGIESGLYTNLSTIAYLSPIPEWLINRPFWLAWPPAIPNGMDVVQYTRNMIPPVIPFTNRKLWQFSWNGPGSQAGMESKSLDIDWFFGSVEDWYAFCYGKTPVTPPIDPTLKNDLLSEIDKLRVMVQTRM